MCQVRHIKVVSSKAVAAKALAVSPKLWFSKTIPEVEQAGHLSPWRQPNQAS